MAGSTDLVRAMKRGDVWQADLSAKSGRRPIVILTRSAAIPYLNKVTIAEITSQSKGNPTEADIDQKANLPIPSYVELDNIQTISKSRIEKYLGTLDEGMMKSIGEKSCLHFTSRRYSQNRKSLPSNTTPSVCDKMQTGISHLEND